MLMVILILTSIFEIIIFSRVLWRFRLPVILLLSLLVPSLTVLLVLDEPLVVAAAFIFIGMGRFINYLKIGANRIHQDFLRRSTLRASIYFAIAQVGVVGLYVLFKNYLQLSSTALLLGLVTVQLMVAVVIVGSTLYNVLHARFRKSDQYFTDKELPTVTVAIPARNETDDLDACLESVLASNYPKLEVIVLDDDSRRPLRDIVKSFAHDGVRFIRSTSLKEHWLAKNQAYEQLAHEATGSLILFCGVDVRFGPNAIRSLVSAMQSRDKKMISVLPFRVTGPPWNSVIQPIAYWWELALPRRLFNRPSVVSSAWIITKERLYQLGGFAGVRRSVLPEAYFAKALVGTDGYSMMRAGQELDIQSVKTVSEQRATAIRLRYPQIKQRIELALLLSAAELLLLFSTFVFVIVGIFTSDIPLLALSLGATSLLVFSHATILYISSPPNVLFAAIALPISLLAEIAISIESMLRYEFSTVEWKGRNVGDTVMHVIPHLPKLRE